MLRDFQRALVNEVYTAWNEGAANVLLNSPTGSGKTVMIGDVLKTMAVPSAVIAHRKELLAQLAFALNREAVPHSIIAPETMAFSGKRAGLRRCLTNLVDNALKAGRHVSVSLSRQDRYAEIAVEDDGPGIPESRREEAFRPFHRLDEGRNLQTGGSGLGLAIARDIARAHGGDILLDKSSLGGLKATIRLPV